MEEIKRLELEKRANIVRKDIINIIYKAQSGHPGGSLSITDILTYLYFEEMKNIDVNDIKKLDRDRLILSKGHCAPALYSILKEKGYFNNSLLTDFRQINGILQGHPDMKYIPGIDMTTGSLGQGLSVSVRNVFSWKNR